jgi:hypothetical protein
VTCVEYGGDTDPENVVDIVFAHHVAEASCVLQDDQRVGYRGGQKHQKNHFQRACRGEAKQQKHCVENQDPGQMGDRDGAKRIQQEVGDDHAIEQRERNKDLPDISCVLRSRRQPIAARAIPSALAPTKMAVEPIRKNGRKVFAKLRP